MRVPRSLRMGVLLAAFLSSDTGALAHESGRSDPALSREPWWPYSVGPHYGDLDEERRRDPRAIRLEVGSFDTRGKPLDIPPALRLSAEASRMPQAPWLVQLDGPVTEGKKAELRARGVRLFVHYPSNSFVVKAESPEMLGRMPGVVWAGPFHPAYRVSPWIGLSPTLDPEEAANRMFRARALVFDAADRDRVVDALEAAGAEIDRKATFDPSEWPDRVYFSGSPAVVLGAARRDDVRWVEEVPRAGLTLNAESKVVVESGAVSRGTPYWDAGVDGSTQIVSLIDNGMDVDTILLSNTSSDAGAPGATHRKVLAYTPYGGGDRLSCGRYTHGTNTSQCVAGNRSDFGLSGDLDGVAKKARIVFQDIAPYSILCCAVGCLSAPASLVAAYEELRALGGHLANGSFSICSGYGSHALDVDQYAWEHKDFLALFSAGNGGTGLACPATAKNVVAVGGHYQDPFQSEFYGSTGPAPDGRMGPAILAPACDHADGNPAPYDYETSASLQSGDTAISGVPEAILTQGVCGTSLASPYAMGGAALARDFFAKGFYPAGEASETGGFVPSGALVKAVLLASGEYMPGCGSFMQSTTTCGQGMGRINLTRSLAIAGDARTPPGMLVFDLGAARGLATGEAQERSIEIGDPTKPLRVVVAWIDRPGSALVNDLRLTVRGPAGTPAQTYRGGNFSGEYTRSEALGGTAIDSVNPFEAVFVNPAEIVAGTWTIRVEGTTVPDGDPAYAGTQPFALVASGGFPSPGTVREVSPPGSASPLLVSSSVASTVSWRWEDVGAGAVYHLYRGDLPAAGSGWTYDHGAINSGFCALATNFAAVGDRLDGASRYYLVGMERVGIEGSLGADSEGAERPGAVPPCP